MREILNERECRVISVLLEKSMTTPEQYPLSLNALTNGCNQKSNRAPVMSLSEAEVNDILDGLKQKRLIQVVTGFGSRVEKYDQRFCNTEFSDIKLSEQQTAIITELMLRGPQTPGELRGRCQRMASLANVSDVESALSSMQAYQPEPLVRKLEREPGKREARYEHCFGVPCDPPHTLTDPHSTPSLEESPLSLAEEVANMKIKISQLENRIAQLEDDKKT
jgi:uncharacterized protein YceH (UPF0502 family)